MPKFFDSLSPQLTEWILKQDIFWTGTAPLTEKHINVSPKGLANASFTILGPNKAVYTDLNGSGAETISHLYENGRITILFNSFGRSPRILRLFCKGTVVEAGQPDFNKLLAQTRGGTEWQMSPRSLIFLDIYKVQTSCGYGVPMLAVSPPVDKNSAATPYFEERKTITDWTTKQVAKNGIEDYQAQNNFRSLDGLPGLKAARRKRGERMWVGDIQAWTRRVFRTKDVLLIGIVIGAIISILVQRIAPKLLETYLGGL